MIIDKQLLKKYNRIQDKISNTMQKELDSELVCTVMKNIWKVKWSHILVKPNKFLWWWSDQREGCLYFSWSVIVVDSVIKSGKALLEECKYKAEERKSSRYITGDIEIS